jgi:hypothetical protein
MQLLIKVVAPWAIIGFIGGLFGPFKFIHLADVLGPLRAYPVHVVRMSTHSLTLGTLLGCFLNPPYNPPPAAILRSLFSRLPLSVFVALAATNMALRMIGRFGRSIK